MIKTIGIYNDLGVSALSFKYLLKTLKKTVDAKISIITLKCLLKSNWTQSTQLFIMPGGADVPYHCQLSGEGCTLIRNFVEKGGNYLGLCAGAYFGSGRVVFEKGGEYEVCADRELKFYPGDAVGPIYGNGKFVYNSDKGAIAAKIHHDSGFLRAYYNGGCGFPAAQELPDVDVLAWYDAEIAGEILPAVIRCRVGKGVAILSGPHIEYSGQDLLERYHAKTLIDAIQETEPQRAQFFDTLLHSELAG
jgi:glutamine amidotransferase-like uncharacterized protein